METRSHRSRVAYVCFPPRHDYNAADPKAYLGDGARLLRPHGSASAVAAALDDVGYVVVDGAVDGAAVNAIKRDLEAQVAAREFRRPAQQRVTGTRGDSFCWVHDADAAAHGRAALARAIRNLKGVAAALNAAGARDYRVDETAMTSRYPGPGERLEATPYRGYRRHQDNHRDRGTGACCNARAVTAILYANPDWDGDRDGGLLRIFPRSTALNEAPDDNARVVELAPAGGRLVIFDSFLWHEVLPAKGRARFAVTLWITRPELQDAAAT